MGKGISHDEAGDFLIHHVLAVCLQNPEPMPLFVRPSPPSMSIAPRNGDSRPIHWAAAYILPRARLWPQVTASPYRGLLSGDSLPSTARYALLTALQLCSQSDVLGGQPFDLRPECRHGFPHTL